MQGSWNEAIRNRFKYVRKYESKKRRVSVDGCQSNANIEKTASEQPKTKNSRRLDFWNVVPSLEGTTAAIHKEHLVELEKEHCKPVSSQDSGKIKALMEATYQIRRKDILSTAIPVKDIVKKYPALATISGVIWYAATFNNNTVRSFFSRWQHESDSIVLPVMYEYDDIVYVINSVLYIDTLWIWQSDGWLQCYQGYQVQICPVQQRHHSTQRATAAEDPIRQERVEGTQALHVWRTRRKTKYIISEYSYYCCCYNSTVAWCTPNSIKVLPKE